MASDYTTHYNLDKYVASDKPNLRDQYNAAMDKIDAELWSQHSDAADAKATALEVSGKLGDGFTSVNTVTMQMANKANSADVTTEISQAVSGLASETYVDNAVSGLASETYVDNAVSGLASESYVDNADAGIIDATRLLRGRKILCVGDSLTKYPASTKYWPEYLQELSGAITYNFAIPGTGFVTGTTFASQIATAAADSSVPNSEITDVIIVGGFNDHASNATQVYNGAVSAISNAKTYFTNARIHVGAMLHGTLPIDTNETRSVLIAPIRKACADNGCVWIDNCWCWVVGITDYDLGDGVHTTPQGQRYIAGFMISHLCGGSTNRFEFAKLTLASNHVSGYSTGYCNVMANNGVIVVTGYVHKSNVAANDGLLFVLPEWAKHGNSGQFLAYNPIALCGHRHLNTADSIARVFVDGGGTVNMQYISSMGTLEEDIFFNLTYPMGI